MVRHGMVGKNGETGKEISDTSQIRRSGWRLYNNSLMAQPCITDQRSHPGAAEQEEEGGGGKVGGGERELINGIFSLLRPLR